MNCKSTTTSEERGERMRIGEVATRAGVSTRALRYYEEQGLLDPDRTTTGQRVYTDAAVERVRLIRQLFGAGLASHLLVELLPAIDKKMLEPALSARLVDEYSRLASRIAEMQAAQARLAALIDIAAHPDDTACPATLDDAVSARSEREPILPPAR